MKPHHAFLIPRCCAETLCAVLYSTEVRVDKCCVMFKKTRNSTIQHLADKHKVIAYLQPPVEESFSRSAMGNIPASSDLRTPSALL